MVLVREGEDLPQAEPGHAEIERGQHMLDGPAPANGEVSNILASGKRWGGWGSNPRQADYEKYGPTLRMRYLHRYHGAVPPIALIAPLAQVTRSTNRSTPYHGDHQVPVTERHRGRGSISGSYGRRATWSIWTARRSSSIV